jgi:hypothetical protein
LEKIIKIIKQHLKMGCYKSRYPHANKTNHEEIKIILASESEYLLKLSNELSDKTEVHTLHQRTNILSLHLQVNSLIEKIEREKDKINDKDSTAMRNIKELLDRYFDKRENNFVESLKNNEVKELIKDMAEIETFGGEKKNENKR